MANTKCIICGKLIIGGISDVCLVCANGVSPEAILEKKAKKLKKDK